MSNGLIKPVSGAVCTICHDVDVEKRLVRGHVRDETGELLEREQDGMIGGYVNCMSGRWWSNPGRKADIMIVGEAPGWKEEGSNKVFVGDSGRELDTWLRSAGLNKRRVWLDNVVRCRPQAGDLGRDSTPRRNKIVGSCTPYLAAEISRLKPSIIIPLGNIPLKQILRVSGIQKWDGKIIPSREYDCWVVPLLHPSAIIRDKSIQRSRKTERIIDLLSTLQAKHVDNPPKFSKVRWQFVNTVGQFDRMMDRLELAEDVSNDYETVGFDSRADEGRAICLALSDGKIGYCVALMEHDGKAWLGNEKKLWLKDGVGKHKDYPRRFSRLKKLLETRENIQHNSGFDQQWSRRRGIAPPPSIFDTEVVDSIIDKFTDNDLKGMALRRTDAGFYDDGLDEYLKKGDNYDSIPVPVLTRYAALDALYTAKIKKQHVREMKTHPAAELVGTFNRVCVPIAMLETDGIIIDRAYAAGVQKKFEIRLKRKDNEIRKTLGIDNPGSNVQLFAAFYGSDDGGKGVFDKEDLRGVRKLAVDKHVIGQVRRNVRSDKDKCRILDAVVERRHLDKFIGTYLRYFASVDVVHPHYKLHVPKTGRPSMGKPSMLTLPRGPEIRNCWIARPGCMLVELDHSQQEMRIAAELSGDANMLEIFAKDLCIHKFVGHNCVRKNDKKQPEKVFAGGEPRARAKVVGFSVIYGKTDLTLSEDLGCTVEEAAAMIRLLKSEAFPDLGRWIGHQGDLVTMQGYVDTIFGRRLPVSGWDAVDRPGLYNGAKRKAVNYPIQSAAGDVTMIGLDRLHQRLVKERFPVPAGTSTCLRLTVYDSIIAEVPEKHVGDYIAIAREEMERPVEQITRVKMKVDVKVGERWGELKEAA